MIAKTLKSITAADLQQLVNDGVTEGRTIEFKRDLPGAKDSDKKEFLADVSSFANAVGGDLIFGVAETNGRAVAADGLSVTNVDAEILRLDHMIRAGIGPRIIGCQTQVVPGLPNGPAIVIRVPRSWIGPHIVTYQQDFRFYSRSTNGKFRMDSSDVRDAVLQSANVEDRIRALRSERLGRIVAGETPVPLDGAKLICIHVVPFRSFGGPSGLDLQLAATQASQLAPFHAESYSSPFFNIDGLYTREAATEHGTSGGFLQLFRNGVVESVDAWMIPSRSDRYPDAIPSLAFPNYLFTFVNRILRFFTAVDFQPPIALLVSIVGAKGISFGVDAYRGFRSPLRPLDRDVLLLPDVVIDELESVDVAGMLRPLMDALWQSFGFERCLDYNEAGKWAPRKQAPTDFLCTAFEGAFGLPIWPTLPTPPRAGA